MWLAQSCAALPAGNLQEIRMPQTRSWLASSIPVSSAILYDAKFSSELFLTGSKLQLGDELDVARAAVAEVRIKRIRRAGQLEARTEGRGRVGKVRMVP